MKGLSYIRSFFLLLIVPLFTFICSVVSLFILAPFASRRACDKFIRFWARGILTVAGVRVRVEGLKNLEQVDSAVLLSNHLSHYDIPVLFYALPISFRMVAKVELFRIPVFGPALRALGFVPVARETGENSKASLQSMAEKFSKGESVWIAPEGTRQAQPKIGDFKMGAFYMAIKTNRAVVPICLYGTQRVLSKSSWLISWGEWRPEVWVRIMEPIQPQKDGAESRHLLRDSVRERMISEFSRLVDQCRVSGGP